MEKKKCILIGVTGGIAAFKICSLVSSLNKKGYEVHVLMTEEAQKFVTPLTFQTLSAQKVVSDMFTVDYTPEVHHIALAEKADLFAIAPATANIIAKVSNGIADDMLTTTFLAAECPKLIVPAMNMHMLANPVTQDNIAKCRNYGMHVMEPAEGHQACGDFGRGRMPEASEIEDLIEEMLTAPKFLRGKRILITAGPTEEAIDPVRCITNHSSGKMGYALAKAARNFGAEVTLVAGRNYLSDISGVEMIHVLSAADMAEEVLTRQDSSDVMILAAAVADYTPLETAENKIHKGEGNTSIDLKRTVDILKTLGSHKRKGQILIGFSMETDDMIARTEKKLKEKNCDYIVANNLKEKGAGFQTDTNKVTVISEGNEESMELMSKDETAVRILEYCLKENI